MTQLTVSALNQYIRAKFVRDPYLKRVTVVGELSGFNQHKKRDLSKAQYFTLKDEQSQIDVIAFRPDPVVFQDMADGRKAIITGEVSTYVKTGRYQLIAHKIEVIDGVGQLYQQMLRHKEELEKEGLFSFVKKPLVTFPKKIAVLTANTGAVIHDIYQTIENRYPLVDIVLFSTVVQGEKQTKSHLEQLAKLKAREDEFDAVIIGRGGGSFEDLFGYNDPDLIRSVASLSIPVVVAVGHDTDHPLIEEVADYVASTPTQAAMMVTPDKRDLQQFLNNTCHQMRQTVENRYLQQAERLNQVQQSPIMRHPETIYANDEAYVGHLTERMHDLMKQRLQQAYMHYQRLQQQLDLSAFVGKLTQYQLMIQSKEKELTDTMSRKLEQDAQRVTQYEHQLSLLNPLNILQKGYTYTTQDGTAISSITQLKQDQPLSLHFADGTVEVVIKEIKEN